jgi:hypothetical protein
MLSFFFVVVRGKENGISLLMHPVLVLLLLLRTPLQKWLQPLWQQLLECHTKLMPGRRDLDPHRTQSESKYPLEKRFVGW